MLMHDALLSPLSTQVKFDPAHMPRMAFYQSEWAFTFINRDAKSNDFTVIQGADSDS